MRVFERFKVKPVALGFTGRQNMKLRNVNCTSTLKLFSTVLGSSLIAALVLANLAEAYELPLFRKIDPSAQLPSLPDGVVLQLLADQDFPPFSFAANNGEPAGLAVDLAMAACAEIKVKCKVSLMALPDLLPALKSGRGDLVLSGPRIDQQSLAETQMTRAWFRSFGRFAAQRGNPLASSDARDLKGRRIGVVKGTLHAAWVQTYYPESEILQYATDALAQGALRTGGVEVLFGDDLRLIYWITGSNSLNCCKLLGGAISDFEAFSRNIAFLVRGDRSELREAFDVALDRLQSSGTTEKIFNVYIPIRPW